MGPTASGKTELAEALADRLQAQLVNADAFQMYRGLDIGTAKPTERNRYELLDILDPNETYGAGRFVAMASEVLEKAFMQRRSCVVVGGTGLYIRALFEEYDALGALPDPAIRATLESRLATEGVEVLYRELAARASDVAKRTDPRNPVRVRRALERLNTHDSTTAKKLPAFRQIKLGMMTDAEDSYKMIESRIQSMLTMGWLEEIARLIKEGYRPEDPAFRAIGYRQLWAHLEGNTTLEEAVAATTAATRQYAKRQRTWLRAEPRLQWLPHGTGSEKLDRAWSAIA